jgi:hypothetical protein
MPLWISQWIASLKRAFSRRNSPLEKIRADWASPNPKTPWLAGRLFELTRETANELNMDDRTWSDLEFDRLFSLADSTKSPLGSQCLYRRLRTYVADESALEGEYEIYGKLANEAPLREAIQLATSLLQNDSKRTNLRRVIWPGTPPASMGAFDISVLRLVDSVMRRRCFCASRGLGVCGISVMQRYSSVLW